MRKNCNYYYLLLLLLLSQLISANSGLSILPMVLFPTFGICAVINQFFL